MEHVRKLHPTIRIVIVAGVVQARCISGGSLNQTLASHAKLHLIALRLSDTKFTSSATTDTGNRLFNTRRTIHVQKAQSSLSFYVYLGRLLRVFLPLSQ